MRGRHFSQSGGAVEVVLASVAVVIAAVVLVVALTRDTGSDKSTAVTTTTLSPQQLCAAKLAASNREFRFLDTQRVQLIGSERQLNTQLTNELSTHSPNAGATDAAHQAVLRQQSDIEQRILRIEEQRPGTCS